MGHTFGATHRPAAPFRVQVERLGIRHVKGVLLYGPPGTGKTLIARQIGKMLNGKEPKVVNGPEVLNKFVGEPATIPPRVRDSVGTLEACDSVRIYVMHI